MQYSVLTTLRHNGTDYQQDELIELSGEDARELVACGFVKPVYNPFADAAKKEV